MFVDRKYVDRTLEELGKKRLTGQTFGNWRVQRLRGITYQRSRYIAYYFVLCLGCLKRGQKRVRIKDEHTIVRVRAQHCKRCSPEIVKHGESGHSGKKTPEYECWKSLRYRFKKFLYDRWLGPDGFQNFLADVGRKPADNYMLVRKNPAEPHSATNSYWKEYQPEPIYMWQGEEWSSVELSQATGINLRTMRGRLQRHPVDIAATARVDKNYARPKRRAN